MPTSELRTDVLVVGGGLGGVAAALTACRLGRDVVLTEDSDWLGGQLTSQAVPSDEHPWIESSRYVSPTYLRLRRGIRDYYRRNYPLLDSVANYPDFNPGLGNVSAICSEPRAGLSVIDAMLAPHMASGRLTVLREHEPVAAHTEGDSVTAVVLRDVVRDAEVIVLAPYVVDATELGDLLDLAGVEHVTGSEGVDDTEEPHALAQADPLDQQAVSWCFALDYRPGEDHVIDRPSGYAFWRDHVDPFWPGPQLSWTDAHPHTLEPRTRPLFAEVDDPDPGVRTDLWHFRRILARGQFEPGAISSDITLVNWPQIDYWQKPLVGVSPDEYQEALEGSRDLSLSFLYWMQTEAPRNDGGTGYPGLRLRPDVTGTADGLAKRPYIRESRRIRALFTVLEQHIGVDARGPVVGSEVFHDSVGIGRYRIDLHPSTGRRNYVDVDCYPFQIPLGALIPVRVGNLLPANKNIGTTHITNGAYRLHPVEWSIGEAVGALAAHCLGVDLPPRKIWEDDRQLDDFQDLLSDTLRIPLNWPSYMRCVRTVDESESIAQWRDVRASRPERSCRD